MNTKLSVNEAALKLNISPQSVKRWINQGKLNGEKFNGKWYVIANETFGHHLETNGHHVDTNDGSKDFREEIKYLRDQLVSRDEQVGHLTQVVAMSQKNIAALTEQLDNSRQMLEDMRHRKPLWKRIFSRT